jgi:subtilase family serine protease
MAGALLCVAVLLGSPELQAQNSRIAPRITTDVNESSLATLRGNVPRLARAEYDQGETSSATQLPHIRLLLSRSSEQQAALDQYLAQLQDKSSPNYHKWLTPEEFGQLYGPADSDLTTLVAWLQSHGLTLETISKGRTNIAFSGTVSQVEEAFHTSIHSFQTNEGEVGKRQFYSNTTDPRIPTALATVIKGVAHLNTIRPQPHSARTSVRKSNSATSQGPRANLTDTYDGDFLYITPADAATIYNTPNAFNANNTSSTSYTGAGVKIGIGGAATITASIVGAYRSTFLGDSTVPTLNYCTSSTSCSSTPASPACSGTQTSGCYDNADDADEAYLDTELSGAMAPGASIYYYASTDLTTGIEAAIEGKINGVTPDIFSLSFGECESDMVSDGSLSLINGYWEQAAGEGIAVTVSSGDSGSAGCDGDATSTTIAKKGLSVSGYASTLYNIAVGGTDFYGLESAFTSYVSTSSIGSSSTYYRTVTSYIPESIWNDSITDDTTQISEDAPETGKYASIVAGGGGASKEYSRPSWQTASKGTFDSGSMRDIPDISLMSGNGYDSATWLVCDDDTNTLAFSNSKGVLNCSSISGGYFDGFGGTSTAAPAFAGILALVEQKTGDRLGQAAETLYELYNSSNKGSIFHDVTVGNNSVPCTEGTLDCVKNTAGYYFESGYDTGTGYDLASGMGSVDATKLITYWSTVTGAEATFTLSPTTPTSISPGGTAVSTITVSSTSGYAGTVTLTCALKTSPSGATNLPSCSGGSTTVTLSSSTTSGIATVSVYTTPATSSALVYPKKPGQGRGGGLFGAGGGAVLAFLVFLGIPARRRSWRSMLGVLVVMAALGGLTACNSGASSSGTSTSNSGTTAGTYTFTVTGTGNPSVTPAPTTTFTVTVN